MKPLVPGCIALCVLLAAPAVAADLPAQMPTKGPVYQPVQVSNYDWTGFYVGVNGGGAWGRSSYNFGTLGSSGDFGLTGGMVGGTAGVNYQIGQFVLGVETDLDWADVSGTATCPGPAFTCTTRNDWLGTARGRIGYAWGRFMPYITGGAAFGDINANVPGVGSATASRVGWTGGGGIEYAFADNWTVKLEYLHVDLGGFDCGTSCSAIPPARVRLDEDTVRVGLNYKFNWGGSVGPRY